MAPSDVSEPDFDLAHELTMDTLPRVSVLWDFEALEWNDLPADLPPVYPIVPERDLALSVPNDSSWDMRLMSEADSFVPPRDLYFDINACKFWPVVLPPFCRYRPAVQLAYRADGKRVRDW